MALVEQIKVAEAGVHTVFHKVVAMAQRKGVKGWCDNVVAVHNQQAIVLCTKVESRDRIFEDTRKDMQVPFKREGTCPYCEHSIGVYVMMSSQV